MPVDEEPVATGTIVVGTDTDSQHHATVLSGAVLEVARAARGPDAPRLRTSHFATCPHATSHRKPKKPTQEELP